MKQGYGYSNIITYNFIVKKLIDDAPIEKKKLYISQAIKSINETDLLNDIIFQLVEKNLVNHNDKDVLKFRKDLAECNYTEDINTKLRAEFLSVFLDYDVRANYFQNLTQQEKPILILKIRREKLFHNYGEVFDFLKKESVIFQEKEIKKLPVNEQEEAYKKIITDTTLFHYKNNSKEFKKELKIFKTLKKNIAIEQKESSNKVSELERPFIVLNAKEFFEEYVNNYIIDPYIDYSYLFQRLLHQEFITSITHFQFMNWLTENEYISEKTKNMFLEKEAFRSLSKSTSSSRENNFNIVFKSLLKTS